MATVAHPHLDPAEYRALQSEAGWTLPLEFIDGEAVVMPPSGGNAASAQGELFYALRGWQEQTRDDGLLLQDVFVAFPGGYAAPDIAWWTGGRRPAVVDGALDIVPDLVIEVLSPKTRENDLGAKRHMYMHAGVRELWLVDPPARTLTAAFPDGREVAHLAGGALTSELLPGFKVELGGVFITSP